MKSAPASPVKAAQVKLAEEAEEVITTKSKSGPHTREDVHANTRRRAGGGGGRQGAIESKSKAGASYKPKSGPS